MLYCQSQQKGAPCCRRAAGLSRSRIGSALDFGVAAVLRDLAEDGVALGADPDEAVASVL